MPMNALYPRPYDHHRDNGSATAMMRSRRLLAGALVAFGCLAGAAAQAAIPRHPGLDALPDCDSATADVACRIDVPNGDFEGAADDAHSHGYQPYLFWRWPHTMADHIAPWTYRDGSGAGYASTDADAAFVLKSMGDGISQTVPLSLPMDEAGRSSDAAVGYTVHTHVGAWSGNNDVRLAVSLWGSGRVLATANRTMKLRVPAATPTEELVAWIDVPAGTKPDALKIDIDVVSGWGATSIDDVVIGRSHPDTYVPAWQPVRLTGRRW